ncbi:MAG: hypothetical protein K8S18_03100 [Desulfobacula sp.]|nr:hypothetical protein [Desulfobacula sp.]
MSKDVLKDLFVSATNHTVSVVNDAHKAIGALKSLMDKEDTKAEFLAKFDAIEIAIKNTENLISDLQDGIAKDQHHDPMMFKDGMKESEWKELSKNWI